MGIQEIVEQALRNGYLTPTQEAEVGSICDKATELSVEEYMALDRLMGALLTGQVVAVPRKQFINVMEELVLTEAITRIAVIEAEQDCALDLGDIAAYALNRLPPLYATTEEGAQYQRRRAEEELMELIRAQVQEAINHSMARPQFHPERSVLGKTSGKEVVSQVSSLLQSYATDYERPTGETAR
ncbi:late competence development ComFB family protein [Parathermosynechococcus lividus]